MQFLNIYMLLGLAAVAIPIIIQILTRKNVRQINWGAWIFLDKTMKKRRRKVLLEDILLLLCRCLALALLALGFARPFVDSDSSVPWVVALPLLLLSFGCIGASMALWRYPRLKKALFWGGILMVVLMIASVVAQRFYNMNRLGKDAAEDVVILLDASASMSLVNAETGKPNFEMAIEEARKYIQQAPANASFSIILGGPVPQVLNAVPVSDRRIVMDTLDNVAKRYAGASLRGTMQLNGSLTAAAIVLQAGHSGIKQLVIVGDGQKEGWRLDDTDRWKSVRRTFETLKINPENLRITWRTFSPPKEIRSLAVVSIRPQSEVVGKGSKVTFEVTVKNAGTENATPRDLKFSAGGKTYSLKGDGPKAARGDAKLALLEPGKTKTYLFRHTFTSSGATTVSATIESDGQDDIPSDDTCEYTLPVLETVKVLLVDGQGRGVGGRGISTFYLKTALRPELVKAVGDESPRDYLVETVLEDVAQAEARPYFSDFAAVVLSDVRQFSDKTMNLLAEFVNGGGGVFLLPGVSTDAESFGQWTYDGKKILPAPIGTFRENKSPFDPDGFTDMLKRFRTGSDLGSATPEHLMAFGNGWEEGTTVVARLVDGTPFILARRFGSGLVVETAAPFDQASGLVTKRSFLPMVHEIAYALARPMAVSLDILPAEKLEMFIGRVPSVKGLIGAYYAGRDAKTPSVFRIDPRLSQDWGFKSPYPEVGFPADDFRIEWRGRFRPPESGKYKFVMDAREDKLTVKVGNQELRQWGERSLDAEQSYPLTASFTEDKGVAFLQFKWQRPGKKDFEIVPASAFSAEIAGPANSGSLVRVLGPHDETIEGEIYQKGENLFLHIPRSVVPGRYTVDAIPDEILPWIGNALAGDGRTIVFSVSSNDNETDLALVTDGDLDALRPYVNVKAVTDEEDVHKALRGEDFGKEIWRLLAWFAFFFLVVEPAIARWIAMNRRTGDIIDTEGTWIKT